MLSTTYVQIDHPTTTTVHNTTAITATTTSTTNVAGINGVLYCIIIQYSIIHDSWSYICMILMSLLGVRP